MLNGPEARHGTVINAVRRAGHALRHSCLHELVVKCPVGILEPSVAMEQGVRVWIGFHGIFKGFGVPSFPILVTANILYICRKVY